MEGLLDGVLKERKMVDDRLSFMPCQSLGWPSVAVKRMSHNPELSTPERGSD